MAKSTSEIRAEIERARRSLEARGVVVDGLGAEPVLRPPPERSRHATASQAVADAADSVASTVARSRPPARPAPPAPPAPPARASVPPVPAPAPAPARVAPTSPPAAPPAPTRVKRAPGRLGRLAGARSLRLAVAGFGTGFLLGMLAPATAAEERLAAR